MFFKIFAVSLHRHINYNTQMKKFKTFLYLIICSIALTACGSDDDSPASKVEDLNHIYYVKYEIESSATTTRLYADLSYTQSFSFTTDKGMQTINEEKKDSHKWEGTYGPFKYGDHVKLKATKANYNQGKISVCKDNGPFVIKAEDYVREKEIDIYYTIDF